MRFVIIGGDAAGMSAASRAKRLRPDMEITVLEQTRDVSYSACGMPYNIADPERDMERLVVRKAEVFIEKNKINLLTGHRVTAIDRSAKTVSGITAPGEPFSYDYDKLFIATGASPVVPGLPGFDLPQVMVLKSLGQGKQIKTYIEQHKVKKAVIIGMGYIALEMCEAFEKRGVKTSMVKPGPVFLPWLTQDLADVIYEEITQMGIDIHLGHVIQKIEAFNTGVRVICEDLTLDADLVLVASGIKPCSEIAKTAGLDLGISDAIAVDRFLKTSDTDIYAAGDCADAYHIVTGQKCWIPLALRANRAGWAVADSICGIPTSLPGVAGTSVFKVFSLEVARSGLNFKEALDSGFTPVENFVQTRSRAHGHPGSNPIYINMVADSKTGRLLGVQMLGKEGVAHRVNSIAVALHCNMTVKDFSQTDLAYAPPFGPVWDPLLTAVIQLAKKI
ncbi:MAG: pyridine nucleotide-disulfide oxidoreductase [Desulfobacterales bacterium RIFOXYA12_FULL_46_15]|nr:MAG: pyridine nucleotide-disulfide oxidoreductase [Desulfobacterales bacterium RIFOXYA12_FULL_46_15]